MNTCDRCGSEVLFTMFLPWIGEEVCANCQTDDDALINNVDRVVDPACGSGEFVESARKHEGERR